MNQWYRFWILLLTLALTACGSGEVSSPGTFNGSDASSLPSIREGEACADEGVSTNLPCFSVSQRCPGGGAREGHLECQSAHWTCFFSLLEGCGTSRGDAGSTPDVSQDAVVSDVRGVDVSTTNEIGLNVDIDNPNSEIRTVQGGIFDGHSFVLVAVAVDRVVPRFHLYARGDIGMGYRASDVGRVVRHCHLEREGGGSKIDLTDDVMPNASGVFTFEPRNLRVSVTQAVRVHPVCHAVSTISSPGGYRIAFGLWGAEDVEVRDEASNGATAHVSATVRRQVEGDPTAFVTVYPSGELNIVHRVAPDISTRGEEWVYPTQYAFTAQRETVATPGIPISWEGEAACVSQLGIFAQDRMVTFNGVDLLKANQVTLSTSLSFTPGPATLVRIGVRFYRPAVGSRCAPGQRIAFSIGTAPGNRVYGIEAQGTTSRAQIIPDGNPRASDGSVLRGGTVTVN